MIAKKTRIATIWLDGCSGCHMSLLDMDEAILAVAKKADIVYGPLVDAQEFPKGVDVTLVEGAVSSDEDRERIRTVRQRTRILVALGDCAVTSNVSSMRNMVPPKVLLEDIYVNRAQTEARVPSDGVPKLLRQAVPVHEIVKVDLHVPGCPPSSQAILHAVSELLEGRMPQLNGKVKFG
jgi:NAD-reducing hydrogenase small subunit